jgi:uncharacterized protein YegL
MGTLPLILREEPVSRGLLSRMKESRPNVAVVYSDGFGQVAYLGGRPLSWSEQVATKYRTRYEVDLSDHRRVARLESSPLPSRGDVYYFHSMVDVGFRVTDPEAVVRRHVTDALVVVYNFLIDISRPVTRRYDIKNAQGAEAEINVLFRSEVPLPEGITIYRCSTRLLPDGAAQDYLRSLEAADRALYLGAAEHRVNTDSVLYESELAEIRQRARLASERRELAAMGDRPLDLQGLIRTHLARHPDETGYANDLLWRYEQARANQREVDDKRTMDLFRYMIEQDLVQPVDVEMLRTQMLGRVQGIAAPDQSAVLPDASSWDEPLPGAHGPAAGAGADGLPGLAVPVYVVIDESIDDDSYFEALNGGIQRLPSDLAGHAEIISAVRLGVIGYARDVAVRMPLNTVAAESYVPGAAHRDGGDLARLFEYLRDRITQDVARLKAQGLTPGRPNLFLVCASSAAVGPAWQAAHQQLTDRASFPYAPNIIVCGMGAAEPDAVQRIASLPESGWIAGPGMAVSDATRSCMVFVRESIIILSQAHVSGSGGTAMTRPDGFTPAGISR